MAHPHPYGEATAALFISTAPILAVIGLLVGDRVEALRRRGRPPEAGHEHPLTRLETAPGLE
jgi:hypothetical protein